MMQIRIGVLGIGDITKRRFLPALKKSSTCSLAGIAVATVEERNQYIPVPMDKRNDETKRSKAINLAYEYSFAVFDSYESLIRSREVDAVYIPLPPALHYYWGKRALEEGKHVIMEKPFTTYCGHTGELLELAKKRGLSVLENYGFQFHSQMEKIRQLVNSKEIGNCKLIKVSFGFPKRDDSDFRYVKELGGGALLDCGGYTLKAASMFLGESMEIVSSVLLPMEGHDVDGFGAVTAKNHGGTIAQLSFGMDNQYKCELELWGTKGIINAPRIFTAPPDLSVPLRVTRGANSEEFFIQEDDQFLKMIEKLHECVMERNIREHFYKSIQSQSQYVDLVRKMNGESE